MQNQQLDDLDLSKLSEKDMQTIATQLNAIEPGQGSVSGFFNDVLSAVNIDFLTQEPVFVVGVGLAVLLGFYVFRRFV